jgi:glutamate--cysteine ligase
MYFNSLEEYSAKLRRMMATKNPEYSQLGTYKDGSQIQLNENVLQKENEFYSSIRLKQNIIPGETQLDALEKRGVQYVEVRILDLNPFEKSGLNIDEMYFLQIFLLFCLFEGSSPLNKKENEVINLNHHLVALFGRKEDLILQRYDKGAVSLKSWGKEIFKRLKSVAELIYQVTGDNKYLLIVEKEYQKLFDISLLPSEIIHREMKSRNENFLEFGTRYAVTNSHKHSLRK